MGHLTAGLAHELNQPLAAIANYADACEVVLDEQPTTDGRIRQCVDQAKRAALRAGQIVRRMRNFVQPNAASSRRRRRQRARGRGRRAVSHRGGPRRRRRSTATLRPTPTWCRVDADPNPASAREPGAELDAGDARGRRPAARDGAANLNRAAPRSASTCSTPAPVLPRPIPTPRSPRSTPPSPMGSASAWRSAARSSSSIAARSGPSRGPAAEPNCRLPYPSHPPMPSVIETTATVFVVDDDDEMRDSLATLLDVLGFAVRTFAGGSSFARFYRPEMPGCLVLDIRMPRQSGLELYEQLLREGKRLPVIFITAHADVSTAVAAMKTGAIEFLEKPFDRATAARTSPQSARTRRPVACPGCPVRRVGRADSAAQRTGAGDAGDDSGGRIEQNDGGQAVRHRAGRRNAPRRDHAEARGPLRCRATDLTISHRILAELRQAADARRLPLR